jgi:hypothetical protein
LTNIDLYIYIDTYMQKRIFTYVHTNMYTYILMILTLIWIFRLPDNVPGISKQFFIQKFVHWISLTPCSYVYRKTYQHTKIFDDNNKDNHVFPSPPGISKFKSLDDGIETMHLSLESLSTLFSRLFFTAKTQLDALVRQKEGCICINLCI